MTRSTRSLGIDTNALCLSGCGPLCLGTVGACARGDFGRNARVFSERGRAIEYYSTYIDKGAGELQEEEMRQIERDLLFLFCHR